MGLEHRTVSRSALAALLGAASIATQAAVPSLAQLSLEELGNIEITSVSKRAERLSDAPTAVFVITADDIRRSGATSLPEVLRLAPNLHVARVSAGEWAISARGFNGSSANKLLVLIDGRSVYTPFFAGVFWDVQNVLLEAIGHAGFVGLRGRRQPGGRGGAAARPVVRRYPPARARPAPPAPAHAHGRRPRQERRAAHQRARVSRRHAGPHRPLDLAGQRVHRPARATGVPKPCCTATRRRPAFR